MNRKTAFAVLAILLIGSAGAAEPPARKLNILAVCAHPDDVEYSVGGEDDRIGGERDNSPPCVCEQIMP